MISNEAIQAEIVTALKADADLVAALGVEIREDQWQGTQFTYPAVRVALQTNTPFGEGFCRDLRSTVRFQVLSMSEEASSQEADRHMGLVVRALLGQTINGAGTATTNPFTSGEIRMLNPGQQSAIIDPRSVWTARANFEVNIYEHP